MGMIKLPPNAIEFFKSNLDEVFSTGALAEGQWNQKVSEYVRTFCSVKNAVPTGSNGSGLVALMTIYRHYFKRRRVMIQSNTMYGVKTMVNSAACELVNYIDCEIKTLMPSFDQVRFAVEGYQGNRRELIILLSHIGGIINPDIEKITAYCKSEGIVLLEDCAHSFGATLNGKHSGTFGDAGVFSFYATKSVPAGEGGVVVTMNGEIGELVRKYVIYDRFDQHMDVGVNIRPSEVQALLIYSVVGRNSEIIENKSVTASAYRKVCKELSIPYIEQSGENYLGNWYKFVVYNDDGPVSEYLPTLRTKTSAVYDYALGNSTDLTSRHACLPIWYGQEAELTQKVVQELYASR